MKSKKLKKDGLIDKRNYAAWLIKKEKTRAQVIDGLLKNWPQMSANYAATLVQLARTELGMVQPKSEGKKAPAKKVKTIKRSK